MYVGTQIHLNLNYYEMTDNVNNEESVIRNINGYFGYLYPFPLNVHMLLDKYSRTDLTTGTIPKEMIVKCK